jgi:hypothetical protein
MKQKFYILFFIGIVLGIIHNNMGAGMCLGLAGTAIATLAFNSYPDKQ